MGTASPSQKHWTRRSLSSKFDPATPAAIGRVVDSRADDSANLRNASGVRVRPRTDYGSAKEPEVANWQMYAGTASPWGRPAPPAVIASALL